MVNKLESAKKLRKIFNRAKATDEKESRINTRLSKLLNTYATTKDSVAKVNALLQSETDLLKELNKLDKKREEELEHIKEKINEMQEKIENEKAIKNELGQQQFNLLAMNVCSKTHINTSELPQLIQGFTADDTRPKVVPFKIETQGLTESEIQEALWENCYRCSTYPNEWEQLFADGSEIEAINQY